MLFSSFQFALFFAVVVLLCFLTPNRWRWAVLLVASYFFYMSWRWQYAFLLAWQTVVNYACGLLISRSQRIGVRKVWLWVAITGSLGALFFFKYLGFATDIASALLGLFGPGRSISAAVVLPVGISFYTFQALSYTIDVYRRHVDPEPHLGRVALYVAFFPQLVAGPIERATHLLGQFRRETHFDADRLASGMHLIVWGLFKKVVIADRLAWYVNAVYGEPQALSAASLLLATYFFAFQIYCDFSGYSDIAIGAARILGYDIMQNFRLPYLATSIPDFWRRWHISLSSWFRDYVYFPLGGSRVSRQRWVLNILVVFLLSGLWHGAGWTFVAWGAIHGAFYLVTGRLSPLLRRLRERLRIPASIWAVLAMLATFHVVLLAWVFFRASSLSEAALIIGRIFTHHGTGLYAGASQFTTVLSLGLVLLLLFAEIMQSRRTTASALPEGLQSLLRAAWMLVLVFSIAIFGIGSREFVYFQF